MSYNNEKYEYLKQYYTPSQIHLYCKDDNAKLETLWSQCQPKEITIQELHTDFDDSNLWLVDSPDGYVPVVDTIVKNKIQMFHIITSQQKELVCSYDHLLQMWDMSWKYAQHIKIGDKVITDLGIDEINSIKELPGSITYDLEIGHMNHRYYTNGICSHNTGKSLVLQNMAINLARSGLNVVYISLELSEEMISMRLDSMVTQVPSTEIFKRLDEVEIKVLQVGKKYGRLHVRQLPQGTTTNDLRAYLKNYEIETGHKCDALLVDYLDLMFPNMKSLDLSNLFVKDKYITEELRGLAVERNLILQTASQLGRTSVNEMEHDHSHIQGGISKIQTADNVMSILATPAMRERGQYQFQFLKTRSSSGVGSKVIMGFDPLTLRIYDLEEDASTAPTKTAADMLNDLRRKNSQSVAPTGSVAAAPAPGSNAPVPNLDTLKALTSMIRR
jgi:DnaB-like helicase C terminal domain